METKTKIGIFILILIIISSIIGGIYYFSGSTSSTSPSTPPESTYTPPASTPPASTPIAAPPSTPAPESSPAPIYQSTPSKPSGQSQTKTFCEADYTSNNISCPSGTKLNVTKFQYYRPQNSTCKFPGDPNRIFESCSGQDYASQAQALVTGNTLNYSTDIHKLPGFNDPCPNIYKQIDVNYTCA